MMHFPAIFHFRVKLARVRLGLTQEQLAHRAGMPCAMISHYETGDRIPTLTNFLKIVNALDNTADYLLGRSHSYD